MDNPDNPDVQFIALCCYQFTDSIDLATIESIRARNCDSRLFYFHRHFESDFRKAFSKRVPRELTHLLWTPLFNLALEILVEAFNQTQGYWCPSGLSVRLHSYYVSFPFIRREQEEEENRRQETIIKYRQQREDPQAPRSEDWHQTNLAPADKARVLKYAIDWLNYIGYLTWECLFEWDYITFDKQTEGLAVLFFQLNRDCAVYDILNLIEECAALRFAQYRPGNQEYDPKWHARKGCDVRFLFYQIRKINEQLEFPYKDDFFTPLTKRSQSGKIK